MSVGDEWLGGCCESSVSLVRFCGLTTFESSFAGGAESVPKRVSFGVIVNIKNFFIGSSVILSVKINVGCA